MRTRSSAKAALAAESEQSKRQKIVASERSVKPVPPEERPEAKVDSLVAAPQKLLSAADGAAPLSFDHIEQLAGIINRVKEVFPPQHGKYLVGLEEAVHLVDCYYRDYKLGESPFMGRVEESERPNLIVISESHARTKPELLGKPILDEYKHLVPEKYQKGHVNLVHCLSYGEAWLAGIPTKEAGASGGTHVFWKLLCTLGGMEEITDENLDTIFKPLLKDKTDPNERVQQKISILEKMEERKIKLIDMTPAYIYLSSPMIKRPSTKKPEGFYWDREATIKGAPERAIIRYSWENYIKPYLAAQRPHNIIILGKSLTDLIGEKKIQEYSNSIGVHYQGTRKHPSSLRKRHERIEEMNNIRRLADDVQIA